MTDNKNNYIEINFAKLIKDSFNLIGKFFYLLWNFFVYLLHLFFKYYQISIILFLLILGLIFSSLFVAKNYSSTFIISSNAPKQEYIMSQINKIGKLINNHSYIQAQTILQLPKNQIKEIKDIHAYWRIDIDGDSIADYIDYKNKFQRNPQDSLPIRLTDGFVIRIIYSENLSSQALNTLKNNLVKYLLSLDYVKQEKQIKLHNLELLSKELSKQYIKLDSTSSKLNEFLLENYIPKTLSNQIVFLGNSNNFNPKNFVFYKDEIAIYNKYLETLKEKTKTQEVLSVITEPLYREQTLVFENNITKKIIYLFIITSVLLLIIDNWKKIKDFK